MDSYPRFAARALAAAERALPVAVVTGARQTGKTTLVRDLAGAPDRRYFSLDDLDVLDQAVRAPDDLIGRAPKLTLDEVQRAPSLLLAIKRAVDDRRTRGRFVVTGSANLLVMRGVADSLAGRAGYVTLWPMARREQAGLGRAGAWSDLIDASDARWPDVLGGEAVRADWRALARRGGFPTPALELHEPDDRATWFRSYLQTYLERDLAQVGSVESLPDYRRLMRAACLRIGQLTNQTELGRDVALPQPTVHRWLNLLETSYQLIRVPAYSHNRTKRLIKTPKLYWVDTGLAMHIGGVDEPAGAHLENLVLQDLLVWRDGDLARRADICYWRTASGEEVDFVIDTGAALVPIEVKATPRPRVADAKHLQTFRAEYGRRSRAGLLLHTGDTLEWLAPGILAAPWWRVM